MGFFVVRRIIMGDEMLKGLLGLLLVSTLVGTFFPLGGLLVAPSIVVMFVRIIMLFKRNSAHWIEKIDPLLSEDERKHPGGYQHIQQFPFVLFGTINFISLPAALGAAVAPGTLWTQRIGACLFAIAIGTLATNSMIKQAIYVNLSKTAEK